MLPLAPSFNEGGVCVIQSISVCDISTYNPCNNFRRLIFAFYLCIASYHDEVDWTDYWYHLNNGSSVSWQSSVKLILIDKLPEDKKVVLLIRLNIKISWVKDYEVSRASCPLCSDWRSIKQSDHFILTVTKSQSASK